MFNHNTKALRFKSWLGKSSSNTLAERLTVRESCCPNKLPVNVVNIGVSQHAWLDKTSKQNSPWVFIIRTQHGATVPECSHLGVQQMWCRSHPESPPCWTKPRNTGKPLGNRSAWQGVNRGRERREE